MKVTYLDLVARAAKTNVFFFLFLANDKCCQERGARLREWERERATSATPTTFAFDLRQLTNSTKAAKAREQPETEPQTQAQCYNSCERAGQ